MSSLKILKCLKIPTNTHSSSFLPLPSPGHRISGKEIEVCGSGSPRFFLVVCTQLAGLPRFQAPAAVLPPRSPVLNPKPPSHGPPARVLSPPSFPARSLLLPKPWGKGSTQSPVVPTLAKATWSLR